MTGAMTGATIALAGTLTILLTVGASAEPLAPTGGAGNTGVEPPSVMGSVPAGTIDGDGSDADLGNAANRSNARVPGTTPGVSIGGTETSGPPGTGGAAGGPSLSGQ